ncbi:hypothetical protein R1flu_017071 [Riccia fluitans]|uniref:NPH3 domain-containing protein n=1 Tax=Riccia fluitans TaxID=41844 RepID=A0ABD1YP15_9MARC
MCNVQYQMCNVHLAELCSGEDTCTKLYELGAFKAVRDNQNCVRCRSDAAGQRDLPQREGEREEDRSRRLLKKTQRPGAASKKDRTGKEHIRYIWLAISVLLSSRVEVAATAVKNSSSTSGASSKMQKLTASPRLLEEVMSEMSAEKSGDSAVSTMSADLVQEKRPSSQSSCNLEVVVNREDVFRLRMKPLISRCGLLAILVKEANAMRPKDIEPGKSVLTVELDNFPGGAEAFELAVKFSYNEADITITVSNVATLRCVAEFLQMTDEYGKFNLLKKTESFLKHEVFWNWNDSLTVLKTCETFLAMAEKADIIQRCANALASRASLSPDSLSSPSFSSDLGTSSSSNSSRSSSQSPITGTWWFHDFSSLSVYLMERVVRALIKNGIDHKNLAKFLLHYVRSSIPALNFGAYGVFGSTHLSPGGSGRSTVGEEGEVSQKQTVRVQRDVIETVVELLSCLQPKAASCRSLFSLLRVAVALSASKPCRKKLEKMIGVQLDKATLDNILVPALPRRSSSLYDVDLIVRLAEYFLQDQAETLSTMGSVNFDRRSELEMSACEEVSSPVRTALLRVGELIDKFLAEVAADSQLKPSRFRTLAEVLPDTARSSSDGLYRAVEIFLEAHPNLTITEATGLCKVINLQKLGVEACKRVAQNTKFPASFILQVVLVHQNQLRSVMDGCIPKDLQDMKYCKPSKESYSVGKDGRLNRQSLVVHLECSNFEFMVRQNQELKSNLKKIHSRVSELESTYKRLRLEMGRLFKAKRRSKDVSVTP